MIDSIDTRVTELYTQHEVLHIDDLSPSVVANKLGIKLAFYDETSEAVYRNGRKYIFLNESAKNTWYEFCHELAHLELHCGNQMLFTQSVQLSHFISYQELKADAFALYACSPTHILDNCGVYKMNTSQAERFLRECCNLNERRARKRLDKYVRLKTLGSGDSVNKGVEQYGIV